MIRKGDGGFRIHIFTPKQRISGLGKCIESLRLIIDECTRLLDNPETDQRVRVMANGMIPKYNADIAKYLRRIEQIKERYRDPAVVIEDYGYGP